MMEHINFDYVAYAQIALSIILVVVLLFVMFKQSSINSKINNFIESFEEIISEHEQIIEQFDKNLKEKKMLIEKLLANLDKKIAIGEELCNKLSTLIERTPEENTTPILRNPEHEKIIRLANKGVNAKTIAKELQKSVGEVELIIDIYKAKIK